MIDLHTHTFLSDGELIMSELVRRAEETGYEAIGITDHCDWSNIDFILPSIVKSARILNKHWKIKVIPGVEITHVPLEEMGPIIGFAKKNGAAVIVVHGETVTEPVLKGTNRTAIDNGADIIAHPGYITEEDAARARDKGVYLEITSRSGHSSTNRHVADTARITGAKLVLNTDTHTAEDLITEEKARLVLQDAGLYKSEIEEVFRNSRRFIKDR